MRDYSKIDEYLDKLQEDIYAQPQDEGHTAWSRESIEWVVGNAPDIHSVLDVGCGEAFCQDFFASKTIGYHGVCLGEDYAVAKSKARNVSHEDFTFLSFDDDSFGLVYSRHSLEHSPVPLLTLMEWHRVSRKYVAIIVPAVEHWRYVGRNHYFVLNRRQWKNLFDVAGFEVRCESVKRHLMSPTEGDPDVAVEYWFLLCKK